MNRKVYKHSNLFASINWQVVNQIDWYLRRTFTKDVTICVQTLRVIGYIPLQWELHACYLFWGDFLGENQEKPRGGGGCLSSSGKKPNRNHFVFLSFGVGPLNWQSYIEIGEMACSKTARCSRGHTIKTFLSFKYKQSKIPLHSLCNYIMYIQKILFQDWTLLPLILYVNRTENFKVNETFLTVHFGEKYK